MNKGKKDRKFSQEKILLAVGAILFAIFLSMIIYVFIFLINNVLPAITTNGERIDGEIHFNLEGFDKLGL